MGPKCFAVESIVNGEENPQNCPFPWDCVTPPEDDQQPPKIAEEFSYTERLDRCCTIAYFIVVGA